VALGQVTADSRVDDAVAREYSPPLVPLSPTIGFLTPPGLPEWIVTTAAEAGRLGPPPQPSRPTATPLTPIIAGSVRRGTLSVMVLEVALIDLQEGREDDFAAVYVKAYPLLATTAGCRSVRMTRGVETPSRFVLLVEWDSVDAHLDNFRATERFTEWRALIGRYFDGAPLVEHFTDVPARP
jgi:heme-degrading monooxygenase HmoA